MSKETNEIWRLPEPTFDVNSVTIDYEATDAFYARKKGEEVGSNLLLLGHDKNGVQVIMKGSTFFRSGYRVIDQESFQAKYQRENFLTLEQIIDVQKANARQAALAYQFGQSMGFQMIETYEIEVSGFPFTAMRYLPNVKDRGFGSSNIEYPQPAIQAAQLAGVALFRYMLDACYDDGQYLQDTDGTLYITDIRLTPINVTTETLQDSLARILTQGGDQITTDGTRFYKTDGFFADQADVVERQLVGIDSLHIATLFHKLESLSEDDLLELLAENPAAPTDSELNTAQRMLERSRLARTLFTLLRQHPDLVVKAFWSVRNGQRVCTREESILAQRQLSALVSE